jgi:hypothetical protein
MRINPYLYGALVLIVFFGTILGFQSAGIWSISGKVTNSGEQVQPATDDVNTIKGWMTLEQISTTYQVPLAELLEQFDLPADTPPTTAIKDLESDLFSVTNLRDWLLSRQAPASAPAVESTQPAVEKTQPAEPTPTTAAAAVQPTPAPTQHSTSAYQVTGSTTFQNLLDWGLTRETIQKVIGSELPPPAAVVKDFVTGKGLQFSTIKTQLQTELNSIHPQ